MESEVYVPPSTIGVDDGPQPTALWARTVIVQSGMSLTENLAVSVVPDTVCVNVPPPSSPMIVIWYWSIGLSPGTAAAQVAMSMSPGRPGAVQCAATPVGADGSVEAAWDEAGYALDGELEPPASVLTTVIC